MHHEQLDRQGLLILGPWSLNLHHSSVTSAQQLKVERQGGACVKEKCVVLLQKMPLDCRPKFLSAGILDFTKELWYLKANHDSCL